MAQTLARDFPAVLASGHLKVYTTEPFRRYHQAQMWNTALRSDRGLCIFGSFQFIQRVGVCRVHDLCYQVQTCCAVFAFCIRPCSFPLSTMLCQVGGRQWLRLRHPLGTLAEVSEAGSGFARDWCGGGHLPGGTTKTMHRNTRRHGYKVACGLIPLAGYCHALSRDHPRDEISGFWFLQCRCLLRIGGCP